MAMQYEVDSYGVVSREHNCFTLFCKDLPAIDALAPGDIAYAVTFQSGAGTHVADVRRLADTED